ncbi:MAG: cupin domain-containing protein [Ktedonobacterales bacterium]
MQTRLFTFAASIGRPITHFGSTNLVMSPIQRGDGPFQIGCMHLDAGGLVGYHQAAGPQLFLVVRGEGWVRCEAAERHPIVAGQAAFWGTGEWHESGTATGMDVVVVEAETLDPTQFLPEITLP